MDLITAQGSQVLCKKVMEEIASLTITDIEKAEAVRRLLKCKEVQE